MKQYIDKAAVVAEIEKKKDICKKVVLDLRTEENKDYYQGKTEAYSEISLFINTLETKEVDLEKEIDKIWNPRFNLGWDERSLLSINHEGFTTIAKYFYELGLKARKGE